MVSAAAIPFDMDERVDERDLKLDLLATQRRRAGQGRDLIESAGQLGYGFYQRRARLRLLSCLAPQTCGLLDQPSLGAVMR